MQWVTGLVPMGLKWVKHEDDHSTSYEVGGIWNYLTTPRMLYGVPRDIFTLS
jgi:hypothetical protein